MTHLEIKSWFKSFPATKRATLTFSDQGSWKERSRKDEHTALKPAGGMCWRKGTFSCLTPSTKDKEIESSRHKKEEESIRDRSQWSQGPWSADKMDRNAWKNKRQQQQQQNQTVSSKKASSAQDAKVKEDQESMPCLGSVSSSRMGGSIRQVLCPPTTLTQEWKRLRMQVFPYCLLSTSRHCWATKTELQTKGVWVSSIDRLPDSWSRLVWKSHTLKRVI